MAAGCFSLISLLPFGMSVIPDKMFNVRDGAGDDLRFSVRFSSSIGGFVCSFVTRNAGVASDPMKKCFGVWKCVVNGV